MKTIDKTSKKREIYSLLFIILSGIIGALLLTLAMTLYYTTEGTYRATNVIIEPSLLSTIRYVDQEGGRGDKSSYVYDKITYLSLDTDTKKLQTVNLTSKQYDAIYSLLSGDTSMRDGAEAIEKQFSESSSLAFILKNAAHQSYYTLLRIEFSSDGNYYRVQLRGNGPKDMWAYFSHPNISTQVSKIVNNE